MIESDFRLHLKASIRRTNNWIGKDVEGS